MTRPLHIAILAAGSAVRFGGNKLDPVVAGRPVGRFALDSALALDVARPTIIVSASPPAFARLAAEENIADLVVNADAQDGLATSVALAAQSAVSAGSRALLLMLADMPLVTPDTLRRLLETGRPAAVRHPDGNPGIPACFTSDQFPALQKLTGDQGAAALLREVEDLVLIDVAEGELRDIDTPADVEALETLLSSLGRRDHSALWKLSENDGSQS